MIRITSLLLPLVIVAAMAVFAPAATLAADSADDAAEAAPSATVDAAAPPATEDEAAPTEAEAEAVPTIVVDQAKHEFSPVLEGEYVTHTFRVANQGTADLEITRVRTG